MENLLYLCTNSSLPVTMRKTTRKTIFLIESVINNFLHDFQEYRKHTASLFYKNSFVLWLYIWPSQEHQICTCGKKRFIIQNVASIWNIFTYLPVKTESFCSALVNNKLSPQCGNWTRIFKTKQPQSNFFRSPLHFWNER